MYVLFKYAIVFLATIAISHDLWNSGVVVPGEVGILLIYAPNFFFFKGPAKDERPVSNSDKLVLHI